ncbi:tetratricopeptide repeat protein [Pedobacter sp. NJ-S-72]
MLYPERKFSVIVLANEADGNSEEAASNMAETIYNEIYFTKSERSSEGFGYSKPTIVLLEALNKRGFEHAIDVVNELNQKDISFKLQEDDVNRLGYQLLRKGNKEKALELFKLNVNQFPESENVYDSLAETYEIMGNKEDAIKNYKHVLEINPSNSNARLHLKKLTS